MSNIDILKDRVAWGIRLDDNEADGVLKGGKLIKRMYLDGSKYLQVEMSIIDVSLVSQIVGGGL